MLAGALVVGRAAALESIIVSPFVGSDVCRVARPVSLFTKYRGLNNYLNFFGGVFYN